MERVYIGRKRIECLRFADDMVAETEKTTNNMLKYLNEDCVEHGLRINTAKTRSMMIGERRKLANIKINRIAINQVRTFKISWEYDN